MKTILLFCSIGLFTLSCKKTDGAIPTPVTPPMTTVFCKLTQAVNGVQGTYDFTYDAAGNITRYSLTTVNGPDKQVLTHTLTYTTAGQLASGSQTFSINGKTQSGRGTIKYTYASNLLTEQRFFETPTSATAFSNAVLTYDTSKRLMGRVYSNGTYKSTEKYEFDANGNATRYVFSDTDGYKDEIISTYDTSTNPEQIITKRIPLDFATGQPWKVNLALTTKDTFDDGMGAVITNGKRTNIKTDAKGFVISATYTANGVATNETYTLADCN